MKKVYKELTQDQKDRGIIFSSELIGGDRIHEVHQDQADIEGTIERLLDDSFFDNSPFTINEIHQ